MKYLAAILTKITEIAKDVKVWLRVLVFVVVFFAGAILFSKTKVKPSDCKSCEADRSQLINALIDIRRELEPPTTTARASVAASLFIDTTRPRQPQQVQQRQVQKVVQKIDSILLKYKQKPKT